MTSTVNRPRPQTAHSLRAPSHTTPLSFHFGTKTSKKTDVATNDQGAERLDEDEPQETVVFKDREIESMRKSLSNRASKTKTFYRPSSARMATASPVVSTSTAAFGLRTQYPEIYGAAVEKTRSTICPNKTFTSDWGDSLSKQVDPVAREMHMRSTYTAANDSCMIANGSLHSEKVSEEGLHKWIIKQKTYYGDLLTEEKARDFEDQFARESIGGKRAMIDTMRVVSAVARPDLNKSHSQAEHCLMAKTDDPELNAMMKEQTRIKTFGNPQKIVLDSDIPPVGESFPSADGGIPKDPPIQAATFAFTLPRRPDDREQGEGGALMLGLGRVARRPVSAAPAVRREGRDEAKEKPFLAIHGKAARPQTAKSKGGISTFKSEVPLQWAPGLPIPQSQYAAVYSKPSAFQQFQGYAINDKFTSPYGATNRHTTVIPQRQAVAVPEGMVKRIETDFDRSTIQRSSFKKPSRDEQARHLKDAIEANQKARALSYKDDVPLDRQALATSFSKDWQSAMKKDFPAPDASDALRRLRQDRKRASEVRATFNGKTAAI